METPPSVVEWRESQAGPLTTRVVRCKSVVSPEGILIRQSRPAFSNPSCLDGVRRSARSHQGRTPTQSATTPGGQRHIETRTVTPTPAWVGPLLTFMVRRGSTVRVRQRASAQGQSNGLFCCRVRIRSVLERPTTCPQNLSPLSEPGHFLGSNRWITDHRAPPYRGGAPGSHEEQVNRTSCTQLVRLIVLGSGA
jgi:hypothetical protein